MGNSFACITSQRAMRRGSLSSKASHELQYSDSEQLSLRSLNSLMKKRKKDKLERNDDSAKSRSLGVPGSKDEGAIRMKVVLTKEEAALLLSMLGETDNINGGVSYGFCGVIRSHEWKPSLQSIDEEDQFC